jgi:hypothetical protein
VEQFPLDRYLSLLLLQMPQLVSLCQALRRLRQLIEFLEL